MSRLADIDWKRVVFGLVLVGLAAYVGFFWQRPRHDDNERYVQSNYQKGSGRWTTQEVTGADLNRSADNAAPLNRTISAILMLGGAALVAFELRHLRR
jgi:hypothetical protein